MIWAMHIDLTAFKNAVSLLNLQYKNKSAEILLNFHCMHACK